MITLPDESNECNECKPHFKKRKTELGRDTRSSIRFIIPSAVAAAAVLFPNLGSEIVTFCALI